MKHAMTALAATAVLGAAPALANGAVETKRCFDKGTLSYVDCPKPAPAPRPLPAPRALPAPAPVDKSGFYLGLTGGLAFMQDTFFEVNGVGKFQNEYDLGYAAQAQIGYEFDDLLSPGVDLRLDLEAGYLAADIDVHELGRVNQPGSTGDTSMFTLMTNAYADFNLDDKVDFFVGGGLGVGFVDFDGHGAAGVPRMNDTATAFVFHLDAGLSYDVTEMIVLEGRYRFTDAVDVNLTSVNGTKSSTFVPAHQVLAGLRLKF